MDAVIGLVVLAALLAFLFLGPTPKRASRQHQAAMAAMRNQEMANKLGQRGFGRILPSDKIGEA